MDHFRENSHKSEAVREAEKEEANAYDGDSFWHMEHSAGPEEHNSYHH